jgi:hypothetical protein
MDKITQKSKIPVEEGVWINEMMDASEQSYIRKSNTLIDPNTPRIE